MNNTETKNKFQQSGRVKVVKGSILSPENSGLRFILNINNMVGKAESPLYPLFDKKWKRVKEEAKGWYNTRTGAYKLGAVQTVAVQSDTWIIGLLIQDENINTNLDALETSLKEVCKMALYEKATIHISNLLVQLIPKLQELVKSYLIDNGVSVSYYEEPV